MTRSRPRPSGTTFNHVIRTLLVRIRALQSSRSKAPWPPTATAAEAPVYRVAPTAWGVGPVSPAATRAPRSPESAAVRTALPRQRRRRCLEIPIFRLPVPRGLPAT